MVHHHRRRRPGVIVVGTGGRHHSGSRGGGGAAVVMAPGYGEMVNGNVYRSADGRVNFMMPKRETYGCCGSLKSAEFRQEDRFTNPEMLQVLDDNDYLEVCATLNSASLSASSALFNQRCMDLSAQPKFSSRGISFSPIAGVPFGVQVSAPPPTGGAPPPMMMNDGGMGMGMGGQPPPGYGAGYPPPVGHPGGMDPNAAYFAGQHNPPYNPQMHSAPQMAPPPYNPNLGQPHPGMHSSPQFGQPPPPPYGGGAPQAYGAPPPMAQPYGGGGPPMGQPPPPYNPNAGSGSPVPPPRRN